MGSQGVPLQDPLAHQLPIRRFLWGTPSHPLEYPIPNLRRALALARIRNSIDRFYAGIHVVREGCSEMGRPPDAYQSSIADNLPPQSRRDDGRCHRGIQGFRSKNIRYLCGIKILGLNNVSLIHLLGYEMTGLVYNLGLVKLLI